MKKLLFALALLLSGFTWSQDRPISVDVVFLDTLTTTERDALTMRPSQFALIANSTVDSVQAWIVDKWINLGSTGSGQTYTFGTGLTNTSGTITVTNPFEEADETKLDGIAAGATVGANWNTNISNIPANLDLDGSGTKLSAGTNVTITGTGTTGSPYVINSTGNVTGPASSTDNAIARFDSTTGKIIQNSSILISDDGNLDMSFGDLDNVGDINSNTGYIDGISSLTLRAVPTDFPPTSLEGAYYWDDSENRMKSYDGTSWKAFLLEGDVVGTDDQTAAEVSYSNTVSGLVSTNAQSAIDEVAADLANVQSGIDANAVTIGLLESRTDSIVSVLGTPAASQFVFETKTAPYTAVSTDAQDNKIILLDYDDEDMTINAGDFLNGNALRIQSVGTGTARIVPGAGVSFAPWDGFQLDSIGKSITLARINSDTGPEDWFPLDGYIKNYFVDPNIGNILTTDFYGNLKSPNSTAAPSPLNNISGTISLETGTTFNGTSAMNYTGASGSNTAYFEYPTAALTIGDSVTLTFKYYVVTAGTVRDVRLYDPTTGFVTTSLSATTGVWLDGSVTYTVGQTSANRIYFRGDSEFIVDNLKLVINP